MSRPLFGRNPGRRPKGVRPLLEALEDRCVPSTTASSNGAGVLTIKTNSAATAITVAETGTPGTYIVRAPDLTHGIGGSLSFSRITSIVVNASGGNDTIAFVGDNGGAGPEPNPSTILTNGLTVSGNGVLGVNIGPYFNVAGNSTFTDTARHGALHVTVSGVGAVIGNTTVTGGSGNDSFTLTDGAVVSGNLTTGLGGGNNAVTLGNPNTSATGSVATVTGNVTINGTGNDSVTFLRASVNGNVSATGTGVEVFSIGGTGQAVHVAGFVSINDTTARRLGVAIDNTSVGSYLAILGGAGNDAATVSNSSTGQNLGLQLGAGTDNVLLANDSIAGNLFTTGNDTGRENIGVTGVHVTGYASFNDPKAQQLAVNISNSSFNTYLAVIGGGTGNDSVAVTNGTTVTQNLAIELGNGNNRIGVAGTVVSGNTTLKTGSGDDLVTVQDSTFNGSASIGTGGGNDRVNVQTASGTVTQFFGPTTIATGVGNATVNLGSPGGGGQASFLDPGQTLFSGGGTSSNDTLNQINVNYNGGQPTITGFNHVTG